MRLRWHRSTVDNSTLISVGSALLALILLTSFFLYSVFRVFERSTIEISNQSEKISDMIQDEVEKFVFGLKAARGVFVANEYKFDPQVFQTYAKSRDDFANFWGALGFGFIRYVKDSDLKDYLQSRNRVGLDIGIHSSNKGEDHMIVELIEPLARNQAALGMDIAFDQKQKFAAETSVKTGMPTLSERVELVQSAPEKIGFIYLLPIYREKKLIGWVFAPIVLQEILARVSERLPLGSSVHVVFDPKAEPASLGEKFERHWWIKNQGQRTIAVGGKEWSIESSVASDKLVSSLAVLATCYFLGLIVIIYSRILVVRNLRKKENSLWETENWLNAIIDSAAYAVIAALPNGKIHTFNRGAEKLLGYDAEELIGKSTPELLHDPQEVFVRAGELTRELGVLVNPGFDAFVAKARQGVPDINEWTYLTKSGERIRVRLCVTAIFDVKHSAEPIGYLGVAEDLSEQKRLELTIEKQRAQMFEIGKMSVLGEMAAGIAHEINTPLAVILGNAEILDEIVNRSPDEHGMTKFLEKISQTTLRIAKIVKGLRQFSRTSDEDPQELVNLKEVLDMTLELCAERLYQGSCEIKMNIDPDLKIFVRPTELSQVFMNLISNSFDAMENLTDKWIEISAQQEVGQINITFTDSGHGIPAEVVRKMMNPFFTTKDVGKGTGLGLSISKGIVEGHGGSLEYDASSQQTRFIIKLKSVA